MRLALVQGPGGHPGRALGALRPREARGDGVNALVTGATGGIGRAIVGGARRARARRSAHVTWRPRSTAAAARGRRGRRRLRPARRRRRCARASNAAATRSAASTPSSATPESSTRSTARTRSRRRRGTPTSRRISAASSRSPRPRSPRCGERPGRPLPGDRPRLLDGGRDRPARPGRLRRVKAGVVGLAREPSRRNGHPTASASTSSCPASSPRRRSGHCRDRCQARSARRSHSPASGEPGRGRIGHRLPASQKRRATSPARSSGSTAEPA